MRIAYVKEDVRIGPEENLRINLKGDEWYVMSDTDLIQLRNAFPDKFGDDIDFMRRYKPYNGEDLNGKKFLVFRTGGAGDLLFMTPAIRYIKETYFGTRFTACCGFSFIDILKNNPYIDILHPMPFPLSLAEDADHHLMFQGLIENNPRAKQINAYDLFLETFKIDPSKLTAEQKKPVIVLNDTEEEWGSEFIRKHGHEEAVKIGIQLASSGVRRNFPFEKMLSIIKTLLDDNFVVFLFGGPRQLPMVQFIEDRFKGFGNRLMLLPRMFNELRKTVIISSMMDLFISPDSMCIHIAGAYDIPQIGLYGPFHSRLRMAYYQNAVGINATTACSPCAEHGHWPCEKGDPSPCFSTVNVVDVLEAVDYLMNKFISDEPLKMSRNWRRTEADKAVIKPEFLDHMQGRGLDVGCGYFENENFDMDRLDINPYCEPDILDDVLEWLPRPMTYDYILCSFILYELSDIFEALKGITYALKPGGHILIYEPHKDHYPKSEITEEDIVELLSNLEGDFELIHSQKYGCLYDLLEFYKKVDMDNDEYAFGLIAKRRAL